MPPICWIPPAADERTLHLPSPARAAYLQTVITLVHLARMLILLLLALFSVMLVIGIGSPETGVIEKVALLALIAGCVFLAAKATALATKASAHLQTR